MKGIINRFVLLISAIALMSIGFVAVAQNAPVAFDDAYTVDEDTVLTVDVASGVLANDDDADEDPLTAVLISDVSNGTLQLDADGSFVYTPEDDFFGTDSFTYIANDGSAGSNNAMVIITVTDVEEEEEPDIIDIDTNVVIIVIQGPVQEINIEEGVISIFGITIEVDPDDPALTVLQIGDVISVSGELELDLGNLILFFTDFDDDDDDDDNNLVLVLNANTIIFISVEVYILDGQVWRDSGTCSGGPPPWAAAHGWRRRCDPDYSGKSKRSGRS